MASIGPRRIAAPLLAPLLAGLVACSASTTGQGSPDPSQLPAQGSGLPVPGEETSPPAAPSPTPVPTATTPAGRPCPVASSLPAGANAILVAGYESKRFRIYFCRTTGGKLYYHGASKSVAAQNVTIPATPIPGGYEARRTVDGHTFVYRVTARTLFVLRDGKTLLTDPITGRL